MKRSFEKANTETEKGLWNRLVNNKWEKRSPVLSGEDSIYAARKLYRKAMGQAWRGEFKLTSGNRHTWIRRGVFYVNPNKKTWYLSGLRFIIHDVSHLCHYRLRPNEAPHSKHQAYLERDLTDYAISQNLFIRK